MQKKTQLERNGFKVLKLTMMTVLTIDMDMNKICRAALAISINVFKLIFAYLVGCHMAICYKYLAASLPCFKALKISFDLTFLSNFILSSS